MSNIAQLQQMIADAERMVVFTGAGISAESGIPTYRGDDGIWHKYDPAKYANINHFFKEPEYYWRFFQEERYPVLKQAAPNRAHYALAALEKNGPLRLVITQNIDGFHQLAGAQRVLELHGNTRRISCLSCEKQYTIDEICQQLETELPPTCKACSGILKPEVVFFGESLPSEVLAEARIEASQCDLFMVIGSSLVVQPAATLPVMAKQTGAKLVIINRDPTPLDSHTDLVLHSKASEVLEKVV